MSPLSPSNARIHRRWLADFLCEAQVVCLGEGLFDCLADQVGVPREEVDTWTPYPGGAPCNVVCACARLGIDTAFISALGKDEMGDTLVNLMAERGVGLDSVARVDAPTRDVYVVRSADGDREFSGFGSDTTTYCDCFISADTLPTDVIAEAEVLCMGTLGLAYPETAKAMRAAMDAAKAAGTTVFIDVNWRPVFFEDPDSALDTIAPFVQLADWVKITDEEAEWLLGIPAADALKDPASVQAKLPNCKGVLVTAGELGAAYCVGGATGFYPAFNVDVVDTTGAGDCFTGGFLSRALSAGGLEALLKDGGAADAAVRFGAAAGALATMGPGAIAAQPHLAAIEQLASTVTSDPLEDYCSDNPETDECRVYEE